MKKCLLVLSICLIALLCGCSNEPPDLSGNWISAEYSDGEEVQKTDTTGTDTSNMQVEIADDLIKIYIDSNQKKTLIWAGRAEFPEENADPYKFSATKDDSEIKGSLFIASDNTINFSYENDEITFDITELGMTQQITVHRSE